MKTILLTRGLKAKVDDEDFKKFNKFKWTADHANKEAKFYAHRQTPKTGRKHQKKIRMHRIIMKAPKKMIVDHINGDTLDNQKKNLRICTHSQNCMNRGPTKRNKTGYKGVSSLPNQKFQVMITLNKKARYLGTFHCKHQAAEAYNISAKKYHGKFAYQNVIRK